MNILNYLYDLLDDTMGNQFLYNEAAVRVSNPAARDLFLRLRDEEMKNLSQAQREIISIESKPFPFNRIIAEIRR